MVRLPLVAIGEVHRNQQLHDFLVRLLRDPRFLPMGGDVVVEFGNARYQDRVDRYVAGSSPAQFDCRPVHHPSYLWLSDVAGAMRIARRAGRSVAATATSARTAAAEIRVNGSQPRTP